MEYPFLFFCFKTINQFIRLNLSQLRRKPPNPKRIIEHPITKYVEKKNKPLLYNLIGVITHIGKSGPAAHFVASCKSSVDNMWYRFNDSFVSKINNVQKDIINFETPYILFYQKSN